MHHPSAVSQGLLQPQDTEFNMTAPIAGGRTIYIFVIQRPSEGLEQEK